MQGIEQVLTVGEWRNGLDENMARNVRTVDEMREKGFYLYGDKAVVADLIDRLDGYDVMAHELLATVDSLSLIGEATQEGMVVTFDPKLVIEETPAV